LFINLSQPMLNKDSTRSIISLRTSWTMVVMSLGCLALFLLVLLEKQTYMLNMNDGLGFSRIDISC